MADTDRLIAASSPAAATNLASTIDHGAMGDKPAAPKPSTSKKRTAVAKTARKTASLGEHPKYSVMIADAIAKLKERGGSSRQAIFKFITSHYKVGLETNKINARVKMSLRSGVRTGSLKQSKGTGASGSFRLGDKKKSEKTPRIPTGKKTAVSKTKKSKTAVRKPAKSPGKRTPASKKAKAKSPAKKVKAGGATKAKTALKKVKTAASKAKSRAKSPAKKSVKQSAKKTAGRK
ncbi:hypothetical protein ACOMHN_020767 [Nucella lapillus]